MAEVSKWDKERDAFERCGVQLPQFDVAHAKETGAAQPVWIHVGAGNLYRTFHAEIAQNLLEKGLLDRAVVAADAFSPFVVDEVYAPFNNDVLMCVMNEDGSLGKRLLASTALALFANPSRAQDWERMLAYFRSQDLQLVTFTITEKGYKLTDGEGALLDAAKEDIANGPSCPKTTMAMVSAWLLARFEAGAAPIALVTTDNFSQNGRVFRESVLRIVDGWVENGLVPAEFASYVGDESRVSFPWSMIDRISPNPSEEVSAQLKREGLEDVELIRSPFGPVFASFANTEAAHYLVIEDSFPNGRPALEEGGVILTDRDTAEKADTMKVTACLNPLHTCLAVFGCLLGYTRIWQEMENPSLASLVRRLGYDEDLPVVEDPKVIDPQKFIAELLERRLPNKALPDAPQRIAADTSQKIPVRYGHTLKAYAQDPARDAAGLTFIPLVIAGWLRYLMGIDDAGKAFEPSPDPLLARLRAHVTGLGLGEQDPDALHEAVLPILSNTQIFVVDLYEIGLGKKIEDMFAELLAGPGAVAKTIERYAR